MYCSGHFRALFLIAAMLSNSLAVVLAQNTPASSQTNNTEVHLRWGARPGVARYRLQLAGDSAFADILFDRVVAGNEYVIKELSPGRYFWRVAPLTNHLGEFSSAAVIEVSKSASVTPTPTPDTYPGDRSPRTSLDTANAIVPGGGWRAAVGDVGYLHLANLRSREKPDVLVSNSDGVAFALDAGNGLALWSSGRRFANAPRGLTGLSTVLLLPAQTGLDDVVVLSGANLFALEGSSGRELWRTTVPSAVASGIVVKDNRSVRIILVENSLQRLIVIDAAKGNLLSQIRLPDRIVGSPVSFGPDTSRVILAYESGLIEVRNSTGALLRSGNAGSAATTPPLFVTGRGGDFIFVGTHDGLTALTAAELNPLGMVAIPLDAPRGVLAAEDLDGDGSPEVIMSTGRGRVIAVSAVDGKTLWQTSLANDGPPADGPPAFADINGDGVLDVVLSGSQNVSLALSGRDGTVVWKDSEASGLVANHSTATVPRPRVAMPYGDGVLLISSDVSRTGLRALEFSKVTAPQKR
jgi:outer membrane protein assembly factor BamB